MFQELCGYVLSLVGVPFDSFIFFVEWLCSWSGGFVKRNNRAVGSLERLSSWVLFVLSLVGKQ